MSLNNEQIPVTDPERSIFLANISTVREADEIRFGLLAARGELIDLTPAQKGELSDAILEIRNRLMGKTAMSY